MRKHQKNNHIVADVFQQHVTKHPNKVALIFEDQEWTFKQVNQLLNGS